MDRFTIKYRPHHGAQHLCTRLAEDLGKIEAAKVTSSRSSSEEGEGAIQWCRTRAGSSSVDAFHFHREPPTDPAVQKRSKSAASSTQPVTRRLDSPPAQEKFCSGPVKLDTRRCFYCNAILENCPSDCSSNNVPPTKSKGSRKRKMDSQEPVITGTSSKKGKGKKSGDALWPSEIENAFLQVLLAWKGRDGKWAGGKFTADTWTQIKDDFNKQVNKSYTVEQLTGKFNRMRMMWRDMDWMIWHSGHTGVGWSSTMMTIKARPDQWKEMIDRRPSVLQLQRFGLPNFELMTEVFQDSGAQGNIARSSNQPPLNDTEEEELLRRNKGRAVRLPFPNVDDSDADSLEMMDTTQAMKGHTNNSSGTKRKYKGQSSSAAASISDKQANVETLLAQQTWYEAMTREALSKAAKYDAQAVAVGSSVPSQRNAEKYSIANCLSILNEQFAGLPAALRMKAAASFRDQSFRELWIEFSEDDRRTVVDRNFEL